MMTPQTSHNGSLRKAKTQTRLTVNEAKAALCELDRLTRERLVEACSAFQDIAFEMEWRLIEWGRLQREKDTIAKLLKTKRMASHAFNAKATAKGSSTRTRLASWQQAVRALQKKQHAHNKKLIALALDIEARNQEGNELLQEISVLEARCQRLEYTQKKLKRGKAMTADGVYRLAVELSCTPDIADPMVLIAAADTVARRLREV